MKFSIERQQLLSSLLLMTGAIEKKSINPLLANVLIKAKSNTLYLCATDTEIQLSAIVPLTFIEHDGVVTVPAKKLVDICRSLSEDDVISFTLNNERVNVTCGRSRFVLSMLPGDNFPIVSEEVAEFECAINRESLISLLQVVHFSMAQQDVRVFLNGMLIDISDSKMNVVTTDGHRLSVGGLPLEAVQSEMKCILPRKGVHEMIRMISEEQDEHVLIQKSARHLYVKTKKYQLASKLIDERFPPYKRVIPAANDKHIIVERDLLKQSLSRASILANEKYRAVTFEVAEKKLIINAINQEQEQAVEELEVDTLGQGISIGVNASYVMDVLSHVPPGPVKISFSSPEKSILIESLALPIAQYVIMPMTI